MTGTAIAKEIVYAAFRILRLAHRRLGLPINLHVPPVKDGFTRIVIGLEDNDQAKPPSRKEVGAALGYR